MILVDVDMSYLHFCSHFTCVYSTVASLQSSLSELNTAYVQLKESVEEKQTKVAEYEAQVTTLSSQLHEKVTSLISDLVVHGWQMFVHLTCCMQ